MIHRHYLVTGRVQGVGFRAFTAKRAEALGLKGRVRNLDDGRVETIASGTAEQLGAFEAALRKGPMLAKIEQLEVRDLAPNSQFLVATGFRRDDDGEEPWTA